MFAYLFEQQEIHLFVPVSGMKLCWCSLLERQTGYLIVQLIHEAFIHRLTVHLFSLCLCRQKHMKLRTSWTDSSSSHSEAFTAARKTWFPDDR